MPPYKWRDPARRQQPALTPEDTITAAITSPGVLTPRRQHEPLARWQARAVLAAVREIATRNNAVCTGDEGTSCYFADLMKENP